MAQPISFVPAKPGEHVAALPAEDDFRPQASFPMTPSPVTAASAEAKAPAAAAAVQSAPASVPPLAPTAPQKPAPMPEPPRAPLLQTPVALPKAPALIAPADKETTARKVVMTIAKIIGIVALVALLAVAGLYYWGSRIAAEEGVNIQLEVME